MADLEQHPEIWPQAEEAADAGIDLREALFGKRGHVYRIFCTFDKATVYIHRVRHATQDRLTPGDL